MEGDGDGDEFGGYRLGGHDTGHSSTEVASMDVVPRENVADAGTGVYMLTYSHRIKMSKTSKLL